MHEMRKATKVRFLKQSMLKKTRVTFVFAFGYKMNALYKEDEILWLQSFKQHKSYLKFRFGNIDQHIVLYLSFQYLGIAFKCVELILDYLINGI